MTQGAYNRTDTIGKFPRKNTTLVYMAKNTNRLLVAKREWPMHVMTPSISSCLVAHEEDPRKPSRRALLTLCLFLGMTRTRMLVVGCPPRSTISSAPEAEASRKGKGEPTIESPAAWLPLILVFSTCSWTMSSKGLRLRCWCSEARRHGMKSKPKFPHIPPRRP